VKSHKDLDVWKRAVDFAVSMYTATKSFPPEEKFGLTSQLRRASVSIASNIAEGAARKGQKEFLYFLAVAAGSASEVDTQIIIAQRVGLDHEADWVKLSTEVELIAKMLQGLIRSINSRQ
jgi:four helix bundle protein